MHLPRFHLRSGIVTLVIICVLLWTVLPYDNGLVLLVRWHFNTVSDTLTAKDGWLFEPPAFPLHMDDIGMVVKTGFSTQERLHALLDAFEDARNPSNVVLVGDYSTASDTHFNHNGLGMPVYNAVAWMIESGSLISRPFAPRLQYYWNLTAAISSGNTNLARTIGETYGWELDILKASLLLSHCFFSNPLVSPLFFIMDSADRNIASFRT